MNSHQNPRTVGLTLNFMPSKLRKMRSEDEHNDSIETSSYRQLRILSAIEADPEITQRQLSRRLGIALGLTNLLMRNLAQKGYVRATQANWRRWLYALTPAGFSHKIQLTATYVHRVLHHYQNVRQTLREQLEPLDLHSESRIAIIGTAEFAELVYLGLKELGIEEIDIFGPNKTYGHKFLGIPVQDVATLQPDQYDQIVVADLSGADNARDQIPNNGAAADKLVTFFTDERTEEGV